MDNGDVSVFQSQQGLPAAWQQACLRQVLLHAPIEPGALLRPPFLASFLPFCPPLISGADCD